MTQEERDWIDVILGLYSDLPLSNGVIRHTDSSDKKRKRIMDYLNLLKEYNNYCYTHRYTRFEQIYKSVLYYRNFIIKPSDIPDSYYNVWLKNARAVDSQNDSFAKQLFLKKTVDEQKQSLDPWIDYFVHGNGRYFPIYEQFWAFQGLQKLGKYDVSTGKFSKRNRKTVYPYPTLDEAALEMTIILMEKYIKNHVIIDGLEDAFNSYNFKAIYEYSLNEVLTKRSFKSNNGIWRKYNKGSDYNLLINDLRGKNTGWCIERSSWVEKYLEKNDIYVFFTENKEGEFVNPRIAIRVLGSKIEEVRGILSSQNIESEMLPILSSKMTEFDYSDDISQKLYNTQMLVTIDEKNEKGIPLSKEELEFIYEVNDLLSGFADNRDYRIKKIISKRNIKDDLSFIFGVSKEEVALDISQIDDNTKVYYGDIVCDYVDDQFALREDDDEDYIKKCFRIPKFILGSLCIYNCKNYTKMPKLVTGSLSVFCEEKVKKIEFPKICGHLLVYGLRRADEIILNGGYDISFFDLEDVKKMHFPDIIRGRLCLRNLSFADGIKLPRIVGGDLDLKFLFSANNFQMPKVIGGNFYIDNLFSFDGTWPENIYGKIVSNNYSFETDGKGKVVM